MSVVTPLLIRLSQYESNNVIINGDWDNNISKPVTVFDGDRITPYQFLIDTQRPDNQTIEIAEDTVLTISYLYYEQNSSIADKQAVNGALTKDNEIYIMYHSDPNGKELNYYIGTQTLVLPAGSYTPQGIAQFISDGFSNTKSSINAPSLATGNNLLIATDTGTGGGAVTAFEDFSWGVSPYPFAGVPNLIGSPESWGQKNSKGQDYYLSRGDGTDNYGKTNVWGGYWASMSGTDSQMDRGAGDSLSDIVSTGTNGIGSGCTIRVRAAGEPDAADWVGPNVVDYQRKQRFNCTIVDGGTGYLRGDEVYFDYSQFGVVDFNDDVVFRLGGRDYPVTATDGRLVLVVAAITTGTSYFEFLKLGESPGNPLTSYRYNGDDPYWIGATEFDLEFDQDGNGLFAFNFLHTPFYKVIPNQPLQPAVLIDREANSNSVVNVDCGILLTGLGPASFWEGVLNFDLDAILLKDSDGEPITSSSTGTVTSIDNSRTTGYLGLNGFLLNTQGVGAQIRKLPPPGAGDLNPIATTLTNAINGREFQADSGAGYYIIEIEGAYKSEMIMARRKIQCSAVVTRQYNSYSMITGYEESSIPYIHSGQPLTFSNLRCRILEPNSDPPTVASALGPNNNVFLRIDRGEGYLQSQLSQQQQLQLEQQQKTKS